MSDESNDNLSQDDLEQKWAEGLMASERAIHQRYDTYRDLKRLVNKINTGSLDIADYYPTAAHLGAMLHEISSGFSNTVFHYYAEHIDPCQKGDVRCFRMECRQLFEHFEELDRRRATSRHIRIVR